MGSRSTLRLIGKAHKEQTKCHVPSRRFHPRRELGMQGRCSGWDAVRTTQEEHNKHVAVLGEGVVQGERRGRERRIGWGIVPSFLMKVDWAEGQRLPLEDARSTHSCTIGSAPLRMLLPSSPSPSITPFPILFPQILAQKRGSPQSCLSTAASLRSGVVLWPKCTSQMLISACRCPSGLRQRRCMRPLVLD